jgi:general secretion pathway protein A
VFLDYYHLREQPFGVTPDPRFLYLSRTHREALASLFYGVHAGRGFMALIASPGMGKTTLLFQLLERLRKSACSAFLFQTQCDSREFLRYLLSDMGLEAGDRDPVSMHQRLNEALVRMSRSGRRFVLVIDEAQNLDDSVLETVRLLSDFETPGSKLIQIILAGQPQLATKLGRPSLVQLRQRIAILSRLEPFRPAETGYYIAHRLQAAGYEGGPLFSREALALIAARSRGVPRNINNLCFNALSLGFALQRRRIDPQLIREVVGDFELEPLVRESRDPVHSAVATGPPVPVFPGVAWRSVSGAWRAFRVTCVAGFMLLASLFTFASIRSVLKRRPGPFLRPTAVAASTRPMPEHPVMGLKLSSLPVTVLGGDLYGQARSGTLGAEPPPAPVFDRGSEGQAEGETRLGRVRRVTRAVHSHPRLRQTPPRRSDRVNDRVNKGTSAVHPQLSNPDHILESPPSQHGDLPPAMVAAPSPAGTSPTERIKAELTRLRKERAGLLVRYTAKYPDIVKIDQQIRESEALLGAWTKAVQPTKPGTVQAASQHLLPPGAHGSPEAKVGPPVSALNAPSLRSRP